MPTLDTHSSTTVVRLLNIGESKTGKTGALASLAKAGYRLWILDFDNGLDILSAALRDDPEALKRVTYESPRDKVKMVNGAPKYTPPITAYKSVGKILTEWGAENFGPQDVIVIDTLTTLSDAAFNEALALGGRLNARPQLQDYGWMADSVKMLISTLTDDDSMHCNVIVNSHVRYFGGDEETATQARGLPNARGQEIPRIVSRYFNTVVLTRTIGSGPGAKRVITTQPQGVVEVATSNPFNVKAQYDVKDGMAALFADILGTKPGGAK